MSGVSSATLSPRSELDLDGKQTPLAKLASHSRLWVIPAVLATLLALVGWWTNRTIEQTLKADLAVQLQAILAGNEAALRLWVNGRKASVESIAADADIRAAIIELEQLARIEPATPPEMIAGRLLQAPALSGLRNHFQRWKDVHGSEGFFVINAQGLVLASDLNMGVGDKTITSSFRSELDAVFGGATLVVPPRKSALLLSDEHGVARVGQPVMYIATPVQSDEQRILAALCLRIRPEAEFTHILQVARAGESGETYAFDRSGLMLSNSRFDAELKQCGLLPNHASACSLLNIHIRDPGVNMMQGRRPAQHREAQPLTQMAASAIAGKSGVDVDGYRDYRGVPVVGAWTWLPDEELGIATELDAAQAFQPLQTLRSAFGLLTGLLAATAVVLCALAYYATKLEQRARRATLEAKRLGQYALDERIGSGGMGVVYRAHHDMLHRPTAVKMLHSGKIDESTVARFEHEVQLTSRLTHPNTVAVYDFGRTADGVFYYAMEYLDGVSLEQLVAETGPLPEGRVVYILRQLCGSLSEAHGLGLVHRDVKPGNIMLTKYGGMHDFVKLLDFGLALPQDRGSSTALFGVPQAGVLMGTPKYMSPEAIQLQDLDARSDLYAVGCVAYFLLTGKPLFDGKSILEICTQHLNAAPMLPSLRAGEAIDRDLERLVMECLAKQPDQRPASAEVLDLKLAACRSANEWTQPDARQWWQHRVATQAAVAHADTVESHQTTTVIRSHWRN